MREASLRLALRYLEAYRVPVQDYTNQTRVDPKSRKNLPTRKEREETSDDPQSLKDRRERPKPLPSGHPEGRDRKIPQVSLTVPKREGEPKLYQPTNGVGVDGEQYGNPVKEDYGYVTRRHYGAAGDFPTDRQQNQGGEAKRYYQKRYRKDKERIKREMKMRYKKTKNRVDEKLDRQRREDHPDRYKRRGEGYRSNADRARDRRKERDAAELFVYDTEGVKVDPLQEPTRSDRSYPRKDLPAQGLGVSPAKGQTGPFRAQPSVNYDRGELADRHQHNRTAALRLSDVDRTLSREVRERSMAYTPQLLRREAGKFHFKTGKWEQFVRLSGKDTNVLSKHLASMRCTCPFYRWQGPEHWAIEGTYQLGPLQGTASYPEIRDPEGKHPVCKHLAAVFRYIRKGEPAVMRLASRHLKERT